MKTQTTRRVNKREPEEVVTGGSASKTAVLPNSFVNSMMSSEGTGNEGNTDDLKNKLYSRLPKYMQLPPTEGNDEPPPTQAPPPVQTVSGESQDLGLTDTDTDMESKLSEAVFDSESSSTGATLGEGSVDTQQSGDSIGEKQPDDTMGGQQQANMDPTVEKPEKRKGLLPRLAERLKKTTRSAIVKFFKGSSDSALYQSLTRKVDAVNNALNNKVTFETFNQVSDDALGKYNDLMNDCQEYLRVNKNPYTDAGIERKNLVTEILGIAKNDVTALFGGANVLAEEGEMTLLELVASEARSVKIDLRKDNREVKTVGSGTSSRERFMENGRMVFFSVEDTLKTREGAVEHAAKNHIKDDVLRAKFEKLVTDTKFRGTVFRLNGLSDKATHARFVEFANSSTSIQALKDAEIDIEDDETRYEVIAICKMLFRAKNAVDVAEVSAGIEMREGIEKKISNRNVAMSRVASLLGISDLLARSVNAELTDRKGNVQKGNLMEGARGSSFEDIEKEKLAKADVTGGELQRQLVCLQVLDALCDQVDRHIGNFFLDTEDDGKGSMRVKGIQGIDNDMAFGKRSNLSQREQQRRAITGADGDSALQFVDKELAERLMALKPEMLKLAIADILNDDIEVNALMERLKKLQDSMKMLKDRGKKTGAKTFLDREDWNEETAKEMVLGDNYYSGLLSEISTGTGSNIMMDMMMTSDQLISTAQKRGISRELIERCRADICPHLDAFRNNYKSGDFSTAVSNASTARKGCMDVSKINPKTEVSEAFFSALKQQLLSVTMRVMEMRDAAEKAEKAEKTA